MDALRECEAVQYFSKLACLLPFGMWVAYVFLNYAAGIYEDYLGHCADDKTDC